MDKSDEKILDRTQEAVACEAPEPWCSDEDEAGGAPTPGDRPATGRREQFELMPLEDIELDTRAQWLIEGLMPSTGLHVLYGAPGTGKSFLALNVALHVAAGLPWAGCRTRAGGVVYVAAEGGSNFRNRVVAAKRDLGLSDVPFWLVTKAPRLGGPGFKSEVDELVAAIRRQKASPKLIILDTLSRSVEELNESSSQDVMTFVRDAEELSAAFGALVMPIHHTGKDESKGMRGSSALHGSADAEWAVSRRTDGKGCTLSVEKMKDGPDKGRVSYELRDFDLGRDDEGSRIGTCVARVYAEAPEEASSPAPRAAGATQDDIVLALAKLLIAIEGRGDERGGSKATTRSRLLECIATAGVFPTADAKYRSKILRRALDSLAAKGAVTLDDDRVALPAGPPAP